MANFGEKSEKMAGGKCACAQVLPPNFVVPDVLRKVWRQDLCAGAQVLPPNFVVPDVLRKVEADYLGWKEDPTP